MTKALKTLDNIDVIMVDCRKFGGQKTLDDSEVPLDTEQVSTKGSKWVIDKTHLNIFGQIRYSWERLLLRNGTAFMGGYAIPKASTQAVLNEMAAIEQRWDDAQAEFLLNYPTYVKQWAEQKPSWKESILRDAPTVESVKRSFRFSYQAYAVNPSDAANSGTMMQEDVDSLSWRVCRDVANDMEDNFKGQREQYTQKIRHCMERARDKFRAFAFLDPVLGASADEIDKLLDFLPKTGPIKDTALLALLGMVGVLSQPAKVLQGQLLLKVPGGPDGSQSTPAAAPAAAPVQAPAAAVPAPAPAPVVAASPAPAPVVPATASEPAADEAEATPDFSLSW